MNAIFSMMEKASITAMNNQLKEFIFNKVAFYIDTHQYKKESVQISSKLCITFRDNNELFIFHGKRELKLVQMFIVKSRTRQKFDDCIDL